MQVDKPGAPLRLAWMRGRIAAACAAVLVGLAPASALPWASFAAAASVSVDPAAQRAESYGARRTRRPPAEGAGVERSRERADVIRAPSIFRSPAGPAPSQAPPAA
ncbi:MAG: hypothetical protein AUI48_03975 [Chloroflexi bacterium 13_1_40CM_2_68_14]|nr:MAG: hypothetical protein AUI48_03975 [Chloroflexi bacterium 13_1_40CM_2_68_14]